MASSCHGQRHPPSLTYVRQDPRVTVLGSREDTGDSVPHREPPAPALAQG